ncbi:MAG: hypothetical protein IID41_07270 [Planctomycetes bacterium]|nr:hypothetical protein [Planctomycetota bacterium]
MLKARKTTKKRTVTKGKLKTKTPKWKHVPTAAVRLIDGKFSIDFNAPQVYINL